MWKNVIKLTIRDLLIFISFLVLKNFTMFIVFVYLSIISSKLDILNWQIVDENTKIIISSLNKSKFIVNTYKFIQHNKIIKNYKEILPTMCSLKLYLKLRYVDLLLHYCIIFILCFTRLSNLNLTWFKRNGFICQLETKL